MPSRFIRRSAFLKGISMKIILASQSPRRRELLSFITPDFSIEPSSAEEELILPPDLPAEEEPELLALAKASDIAGRFPDALVIGSDTVVIAENAQGKEVILGKPSSKEDAAAMLRMLSGKRHYVVTGCALVQGTKVHSFRVRTAVDFYSLSEEEIQSYIATNEPMDKAGAYGIQGQGSLLIRGIEGDYFTVVGLPVSRLKREMDAFLS